MTELERAWREGFQAARECLSEDEAFTLTADVEEDCWLESKARSTRPMMGEGALREALKQAHEFAVLFLAFDGRDRHTDRMDKTLDQLSEMAVKLDEQIRAALASIPPLPNEASNDMREALGVWADELEAGTSPRAVAAAMRRSLSYTQGGQDHGR